MRVVMPEGKRCAVCLTFDFDALALQLSFGFTAPGALSRGEFGARVGIYRILDLLNKYNITTTFFVPGHTADTFPEQTRAVHARGHELAHHGYCHENTTQLTYEEERAILRKGMESLRRITGSDPVGYRSPVWDASPHTVQLLLEHNFIYSASYMADDFHPYRVRVGDEVSMTEPVKFGKETSLIDIPSTWYLTDTVPLEFSYPSFLNRPGAAPSAVLEIWTSEFDYLYENVAGGVLTMTLHPFSIGHAYRVKLLEKFITHMRSRDGVWFAKMVDVARACVD